MTSIKACLEKKEERLLYPESYSSTQMKNAEQILELFGNITISVRSLKVRLGNNPSTVIIMPLRNEKLSGVFSNSDIPETHKVQWAKNSLVIKPKRKFQKLFPYTLIIRRFFKLAV